MLFSRRNKGPLARARRAKKKAEAEESDFKPVESEERAALLSSSGAAPTAQAPVAANGAAIADPTQRILTALGRFHKQVARAKIGADQEQWSDDCMHELIGAVEIAASEGWKDVVEVLTETGRILQTYEDAQRAKDCIVFLSDAHEILSLMVGDLIVGDVRAGVRSKWRDLYVRALADLDSAGLVLVRDDKEVVPPKAEAAPAVSDSVPADENPFEMPAEDTQAAPESEVGDLPSLGDLPPLSTEYVGGAEPVDESLLDKEQDWEEPALDIPRSMEEKGSEDESQDADDSGLFFAGETESPAKDQTDPEVVEFLDALCDGLGRIENNGGQDTASVFAAMDEGLSFLEARAEEKGQPGAASACRTLSKMCQCIARGDGKADDKFLELGYAFGGIYTDSASDEGRAAMQTWALECAALVESWTASTGEEAPAEQPPVEAEPESIKVWDLGEPEEPEAADISEEPDGSATEEAVAEELDAVTAEEAPAEDQAKEDTPQALLDTAQRGAAEGRPVNAKLLALQAAAGFAKSDADEAEARVVAAENRLQEAAKSIATAWETLQASEARVTEAESSTVDAEKQAAELQEKTAEAGRKLGEINDRVTELDRQIEELQQQREEEMNRQAEANAALETERHQEELAQAELGTKREDEESARVQLEENRQEVKSLERKRTEIETEMGKARDYLARQRSSLDDIEQMIAQIQKADEDTEEEDDALLF